MSSALAAKLIHTDKKTAVTLLACTSALVFLIIGQDFLRARLNKSAFYFSESFLFSAFWWLFAPFLFGQLHLLSRIRQNGIGHLLVLVISPVLIHLFAFPAVVWLISKAFYYHTYAFDQTLTYAFSEHVYLLVTIYSTSVLAHRHLTKNAEELNVIQPENSVRPEIATILVAEGNNKLTIALQEVYYFSAAPPYIFIHLEARKYIYSDSLRSMAAKLNGEQFVRVHKSTLVNMNKVASYSSRLNGDYDLVLKNQVKLRVSRNFAADFKQRFQQSHRLT